MKKLILIAIASLIFVSGCTDPQEARRTLKMAGYTDIKTGDYDMWACGSEDFYATKFIAKNQSGNIARGVVCSGLIVKSSTIRF